MNTEHLTDQLLTFAPETGGGHSFLARALLGSAAIGLAAGIVDHTSSRLRWPSTTPSFTIHPADHGASPDTLIYVDTGFNSPPTAPAEALLPALTKFGTVAVVRGADSGFDGDKHTQAITKLARDTQKTVIVPIGLSMGGTQNLPTAAQLKADENLGVFPILNGSPIHRDDVRGTARQRSLATLAFVHNRLKLNDSLRFKGGVATRVLLETVGYAIDSADGNINLRRALRHAITKIRQEDTPSNSQCLSRAGWFWTYDATSDLDILSDSPIGYMGPTDPSRDSVIDNDSAVARIPGPVIRATDPKVGHANPCDRPTEHQTMVATILREFGLRSADERRSTIYLS